MKPVVIASHLAIHARVSVALQAAGYEVIHLATQEELENRSWKAQDPSHLFFLHWSYRIPAEIYDTYECIIFHMADLPRGRGGSPLQNLIAMGHENTTLCALRCCAEMDAGPVYLRSPLSLLGTASEILARAGRLMLPMVLEILEGNSLPIPQEGEPTVFRRRRPEDGNLAALTQLERVYDYIRMLDADGYPPAFLESDGLVFEFSRASIKQDHVMADVRIRKKSS